MPSPLPRGRTAVALVACLVALLVAGGCTPTATRPSAASPVRSPSKASPATRSAAKPASRTATPTPVAANPGGLTDRQLVGQLFVIYLYGSAVGTATAEQRQANLDLFGAATPAEVLLRWHPGGVILIDHNTLDPARPELSTGNVDGAAQISALTTGLQRIAETDTGLRLLIGTDQEGGQVQRITSGVSWRPSEQQIGQESANQLSCSYYRLGQQLHALGVNQDYAPVADVVRTSGGVIGDRSFGPDPTVDARDVVAAVTGLQDAGVLATLKHWPGHGSTPVDSHEALPQLTLTPGQWESVDRYPFQAAAQSAASVMVGHLALRSIDPSGRPATLSPKLVTGQLRGVLHYQGLVMTDSLWMAPMQQAGTPAQVAVQAIQAGDDLLLETPDLPSAFDGVLHRVQTDRGFRELVQAAVRHILAAKSRTMAIPAAKPAC